MIEALAALSILLSTCTPGWIARHDAFSEVFENFPKREDACPNCEAHFAAICSDHPLGQVVYLLVNNQMLRVVVSDCASAKDIPTQRSLNRLGDLSQEAWNRLHLPARTVPAVICDPNESP